MSQVTKVLLVDDDADIREIVSAAIQTEFNVEVIEAGTGNDAIALVKKDPNLLVIISDHLLPNGTGADLYRFVKGTGLKIPFIICAGDEQSEYPELKDMDLTAYIVKPNIMKPLTLALSGLLQANNLKPNDVHADYFAVKLKTFLRAKILEVDLFVKLNEDKYVKVYKANDTFNQNDFERFAAKDIDYLYIKKTDLDKLIHSIESKLVDLKTASELGLDETINVTAAAVEIIHQAAKQLGFTPEVQKLTKDAVDATMKSIKGSPFISSVFESFAKIKDGSYIVSHSLATSYIVCGIAELMGWSSESTARGLVLASFLHDICVKDDEIAKISSIDDFMSGDQMGKFTTSDIDEYIQHPKLAADFVSMLDGVPFFTKTIVLEHHERADGNGFPSRLKATEVNEFSAAFIIAEDMVNFMYNNEFGYDVKVFLALKQPAYQAGPYQKIFSKMQSALKNH